MTESAVDEELSEAEEDELPDDDDAVAEDGQEESEE